MAKVARPLPVTIIAGVYIAAGTVGFSYHLATLRRPVLPGAILILVIRLAAIVAGVYLFRGRDWARWLAVAWIAYHVVLSFFHPVSELVLHAAFCAAIVWFLYQRQANAYFRRTG